MNVKLSRRVTTMAKSKEVEPKVRALLELSEYNRSSDKLLLLEFWEAHCGLVFTTQQRALFMDAVPAESITRARRSLRAEFPGSKEVEAKRYELFEEEQAAHSKFSPARWFNR